ncbi:SANT/Myb_domain [Hexamita inflata]|uniref:SANT/Myb domain n=1 Tax=Hexamita inflata TaxID=28002 RepID=A0AA86S499_9EUKA|nr:SANT/Myb domain [Hexamita inflata]
MKITQLWSEEECKQFAILIKKYFNDFHQIACEMNRTYTQIRSHYYNILRKQNIEEKENKDNLKPNMVKKLSFIIFDNLQQTDYQ